MPLIPFLCGAICTAFAAAAFYFLKFRVRTGDRLFSFFSVAFALLAVERLVLGMTSYTSELQPQVCLIRLAAFTVILIGIWDKNRVSER